MQVLTNDEQVQAFNERKDELFAPAVAQSALFLLKELLKYPIKKTRVLHHYFPPIRELLHTFEKKINPKKALTL